MSILPQPQAPGNHDAPLVVVLAPRTETADPELEYYHDYSQSYDEFSRALDALGVTWRWQPVTTHTFRSVLDALAREQHRVPPVVFNLCDGDDSNDVPGIDVIHHLDTLGLAYTGSDAAYYRGTTSKIEMKQAFEAAGVATAPWAVVSHDAIDATGLLKRLGAPLIVKPAVSAGSMGITTKSVVHTAKKLREQVRLLDEGYRGWDLVSGGILVEKFIAGREFTTFITGSGSDSARARVYPPVERDFHPNLPPTERFLSYDRLWEVHERETPMAGGEDFWKYAPVPEELAARVQAISWDAYVAVGGCGYGRVDLRMDDRTGELFVLEVNAQCGLSEDENYTSIGAVLRVAECSFADLVGSLVADATARRLARARSSAA